MKVKNMLCECGCEEFTIQSIKNVEFMIQETVLICKKCGEEIDNQELKEQFNKNMGVICE
jgi:predicted SprT family Zn-dependent metalloprotease